MQSPVIKYNKTRLVLTPIVEWIGKSDENQGWSKKGIVWEIWGMYGAAECITFG